jgi:hypothetical protein
MRLARRRGPTGYDYAVNLQILGWNLDRKWLPAACIQENAVRVIPYPSNCALYLMRRMSDCPSIPPPPCNIEIIVGRPRNTLVAKNNYLVPAYDQKIAQFLGWATEDVWV